MKNKLNFRSVFLFFCIFLILFSIIPSLHGQGFRAGPIVYSVPGMDKVEVHSDIVYKRDGRDEMKMDIYIPPDLAADVHFPAVIFVHGGPLENNPSPGVKDWPFYRSYGKLMAASGLVGVCFDHRYTGVDQKAMDTSFSDVEAAIHFVRTKSASYHIDPDRIALWVFSGGGPHLSIVLRNQMTFIRCMVSYYGLHDLSSQAARAGETAQSLKKYSPVTYLSKEYKYRPPVLIVRAGLDNIPDLNRNIKIFLTKMLSLNSDVSMLNHPFGLHGFDCYNDDEQSRDIIKATIEFLKSRLNRPSVFKAKEAYTASEFSSLLLENKIDAAIDFILTIQKQNNDKKIIKALLGEDSLARLAGSLLQSDPTGALKFFEFAREQKPHSPISHLFIAICHEFKGNIDQAVAEAKKAMGLLEKTTELDNIDKKTFRDAAAALIKRHE